MRLIKRMSQYNTTFDMMHPLQNDIITEQLLASNLILNAKNHPNSAVLPNIDHLDQAEKSKNLRSLGICERPSSDLSGISYNHEIT